MKQKTAIRQLIEHIETQKTFPRDTFMMSVYKKAKELESVNEQQIIDAHKAAKLMMVDEELDYKSSHIWFGETFEKL